MRTAWKRWCWIVLVAAMTGPGLRAQNWYVDVADPNCSIGSGGPTDPFCNIMDAVTAASSGETIHIAAGTYFESLLLDRDLTLIGTDGDTATFVDGSGTQRVVLVMPSTTVEIRGLTLTNGSTAMSGGAMFVDDANVTLVQSTVSQNFAAYSGGGIYQYKGTVHIEDTTIDGNSVYYPNGFTDGGGIYNRFGSLTLVNTTVSNNMVDGCYTYGGGIATQGGPLTMVNCTVSGNQAVAIYSGYGGGVNVNNSGTLDATGCAFLDNHTTFGGGGGVYVDQESSASIENSTFSDNSSRFGGGVRSFGPTTVTACTLVNNTGTFSGGGVQGACTLSHSLLANNLPEDCQGTVPSAGYNLIEDVTGCTLTGDVTGNVIGVDPNVGALGDYGGPTVTVPLLVGSAALDAGDPGAVVPATDQRGVPRPTDGVCDGIARRDIGAFEKGLFLNVEPERAFPGNLVTLDTRDGQPGKLAALFVVAVNGVPTSLLLDVGSFNASGERSLSGLAPASLTGLTVSFLSVAFDSCDAIALSNVEVLRGG